MTDYEHLMLWTEDLEQRVYRLERLLEDMSRLETDALPTQILDLLEKWDEPRR